jgi:hypothetical protein
MRCAFWASTSSRPVDTTIQFELPERLKLREIDCDNPDVEVVTVVCDLP